MLKKNSLKHIPPCEVPQIISVLRSLTTFSGCQIWEIFSSRANGTILSFYIFYAWFLACRMWELQAFFPQGLCAQLASDLALWKTIPLTSTSPVRSLYLSRMTGRAGFSLRVLERSLKGCSRAGEGEERLISLSPRLKLLLCDPGRSGWHS